MINVVGHLFHTILQYLQLSLIDLECLTARSSSYFKYSASISLPISSWRVLSSPTTTIHRLISRIRLAFRQCSTPSFTTFMMEASSNRFQSSRSVDFQQIARLSSDRQTNLLCGSTLPTECFTTRYPLRRLDNTSPIDSDSELSSLLRLEGELEGVLLRRVVSQWTYPSARESKSRILVTLSAVLAGSFQASLVLLEAKSINCQNQILFKEIYDLQQCVIATRYNLLHPLSSLIFHSACRNTQTRLFSLSLRTQFYRFVALIQVIWQSFAHSQNSNTQIIVKMANIAKKDKYASIQLIFSLSFSRFILQKVSLNEINGSKRFYDQFSFIKLVGMNVGMKQILIK